MSLQSPISNSFFGLLKTRKKYSARFAGNPRKAALQVLTFTLPNAIINNAVWV
jgi:hypothetical protein